MSIGSCFQMFQSGGLGLQGTQLFSFTPYGHLSLIDVSTSFQQVNMCHHSLEDRGLLRVHHSAIALQSSLL